MNEQEAIEKLTDITQRRDDNEQDHIDADEVLLRRLEALNETRVVQAYCDCRKACRFWYA